MKRLARTFLREATRAVFVLGVLPALYALEPFRRIRFMFFSENRMAHLAADPDLICRRRQLDGEPPPDEKQIAIAWNPANRHLLDMWKRHLPIIESRWLRRASQDVMPILDKTRFRLPSSWTETDHREWSLGKPTLRFTEAEERQGRDALARMGIGADDWFIGFQSRDPAYEATRVGFGPPSLGAGSNRDCPIESYLPAAEWIAARGGFALRMGAAVEVPLGDTGERIIDYATRHRDDFLDIYLLARCRFFLGNNSGLFGVPLAFNVPIALANYLPYACVGLGRTTLYTPKLLRRVKDGTLLTFHEIRALGLMEGDIHQHRRDVDGGSFYADAGLEWVSNDAEDILGLCMDMMDQVEGRPPPQDARDLQEAYRGLYSGAQGSEFAGRIGPRFALRHRHLLEREMHPPGRAVQREAMANARKVGA